MEKIGVFVISYGSRCSAIIDSLFRSNKYIVEIFVVDKQKNPFNFKLAKKHVVIPDLEVNKICDFVNTNKNEIDFGIVGPEGPIIEGIRDEIEKSTGVPVVCPTKKSAIEGSKVAQRLLIEKIVPDANPRFMIFNPDDHSHISELKKSLWRWLDKLDNNAVVKPDKPTAGKGVGVWGDHFVTRNQLFEHFLSNYEYGSVIVEEKIIGEESSFQAFCDGKHLEALPETRDYKRAFEDDKGPNTGGMGSYKDVDNLLPFMNEEDRVREKDYANRIFKKMSEIDENGMRGVPLYIAYMHTGKKSKILEINSRPGDPEIINLLPLMKNDLVDLCFDMINGSLKSVYFEKKASVVLYKVPPKYGGKLINYKGNSKVYLNEAYNLSEKYAGKMKIYPGSLELRNEENYALTSRTVCVVGIGDNINEAREISKNGIEAIKGGGLWYRTDIASENHIRKSIENIRILREN